MATGYHVCEVAGLRAWGDAGMQILQHGIPKALLRQIFGESCAVSAVIFDSEPLAAEKLCCNAFIAVMKTAQFWDGNDPPDLGHLPRNWRLLVEL